MIKLRFPGNYQRDAVPPEAIQHLHWVQTVQEAYGSLIQIYNNKGAMIMPKVDTMRWDIGRQNQNLRVIANPLRPIIK